MENCIVIKGARENNLKNINLSIPKNKLIVLTGLSGSGKSSLAYDTLQKECQRQYMESLGMVTDYLSKPKVDCITGLSPSISVGQHLTNRSPRSTVGTATEVFTYLRILFAKIGLRPCPNCGGMVGTTLNSALDVELEAEGWEESEEDTSDGSHTSGYGRNTFPCPSCHAPIPEMSMSDFSFNKPDGACPTCTGLGTVYEANLSALVDEERSIVDGAIAGWDIHYINRNTITLTEAARFYGFTFDVHLPIKDLGQIQKDLLFYGVENPRFKKYFPDKDAPKTASKGRFEGIATNVLRRYGERADDKNYREKMEKILVQKSCPDCGGTRLRKESRLVTVGGKSIVELSQESLDKLAYWLDTLPSGITLEETQVAQPILSDLKERVKRLIDVGVGYLTMERPVTSLSGGEAQRLRLAALLGSGLTGVLYVLDEPTTGLHPRDTVKLLQVLKRLGDMGNTVLLIEHDVEVMKAADYIIDIGPGAGRNGGEVVAAGTPDEIREMKHSITGKYLSESGMKAASVKPRNSAGRYLEVTGASQHNLKNVNVKIPVGELIAVAGVSGSGKSTLMFDIVDKAGRRWFNHANDEPGKHESIKGWEHFSRIITVDQTPIGRISRSNVATYTDLFTPIRNLFAGLPEAKLNHLSARHFSFNVPGGRCERCEGAGVLTIGMHFMPDVEVRCPVCHGKRFKKDILSLRYKGFNISQILDMTIQEAREVFCGVKEAAVRLALLEEVGLGYLQLGQSAATLSGGEAQRIKLAKELGKSGKGNALYLLDEPTTGLHPYDTGKLLALLQRLVSQGNTVCVIEHNLDVISAADWVIDMGPEGGENGGCVIVEGTPYEVSQNTGSITGKFLREMLK